MLASDSAQRRGYPSLIEVSSDRVGGFPSRKFVVIGVLDVDVGHVGLDGLRYGLAVVRSYTVSARPFVGTCARLRTSG